MKIAILGAVTGITPEEFSIYETYCKVVYKYFKKKDVFSPAVIDDFMNNFTAKHKHATRLDMLSKMVEFDLKQVESSDAVLADISINSTGMGMELSLCKNKDICFFAREGKTYSNMIEGMFKDVPVVRYTTPQDLERKVDAVVRKYLKFGTFVRQAKKAGCVFFDPKTKKVGLIYRQKQDDYSFPKGHLEQGETLIECALRETAEETKRDVKLLSKKPIATLSYVDGVADNAIIDFYLAIDIGPSANTSTDTHELVWVNLDDVEKALTYDDLKDVWKVAYPKIKEYK